MRRRKFITLLAGFTAFPLAVAAQQRGKIYRVGTVYVADPGGYEEALLAALGDRGYVLGRNLEYDARYARGDTSLLPALVDETIALNPDVLVANEAIARLMLSKTKTIPIVFMNASDPVAAGLAESYAKPGRNVTGISIPYSDLSPKRLEIMREIPRLERVAQFLDVNVPGFKNVEENTRDRARKLGVESDALR